MKLPLSQIQMETATIKEERTIALIKALDSAQNLNGLDAIQDAQLALEDLVFPHRKMESWKYTKTTKIGKQEWNRNADLTSSTTQSWGHWSGAKLVLVNGVVNTELSHLPSIKGVTIKPIAKANSEELEQLGSLTAHKTNYFEALNTAYSTGGYYIHVAKNCAVDTSLLIEHICTGKQQIIQPRNFIKVEESAEFNMAFLYRSDDGASAFQNELTEVFVGENAVIRMDNIQDRNELFDLNTIWAAQERNSRFTITTITKQGDWVRNNINVRVNGENCETNLYGTYRTYGNQHVDNHTMIDHKVPHCESNEHYKGILYDKSSAVFNGKVFVREDAQKTNAFQQNANILMSDDANMNSKPELEIYADDVKCSHGSTTGQFDDEAIFYLMARAISETNARELLVEAFLSEVIEHVYHEELLTYVRSSEE